jgi:8-oxo-dGTP pyrophosphatase MutT (NUDIX family)/DNA-binding XRE family transcriptional regulator
MATLGHAFGFALQAARKRRGWRQKDLADAAGLPQNHVSRIERGTISPSLATQERLAAALEVSLAELVGDAERERERWQAKQERPGPARRRAMATQVAPSEPIRPLLVAAVIPNGDRVLMTKRRYAGEPGMWSWPAGHVDPGERPEDAVLRELNEELQISGAMVVRHLGDVDYHGDVSHLWPKSGTSFRHGYRMIHYLVVLSSSTVEVIDHEELLEVEWLTLDQVREATGSFPSELAEAAVDFAGEAIRQSARLPSEP